MKLHRCQNHIKAKKISIMLFAFSLCTTVQLKHTDIFSYLFMKSFVGGYSLLSKALLMSTHNIRFHGQIRKTLSGFLELLSRSSLDEVEILTDDHSANSQTNLGIYSFHIS